MPEIPNKLYFRIGEVSDLVGVKPYVLRYWESEFTDIKPSKSKSGQRLYKRRDVELLLKIKELLYEERFTINGARKRLKDFGRGEQKDDDIALDGEMEDVEEQEGPRQLDVFAPEPEEERVSEARRQQMRSGGDEGPSGRVNTKALLKIRKDLEEILTVLRA